MTASIATKSRVVTGAIRRSFSGNKCPKCKAGLLDVDIQFGHKGRIYPVKGKQCPGCGIQYPKAFDVLDIMADRN